MINDVINEWKKVETNDIVLKDELLKNNDSLIDSFSNKLNFKSSRFEAFIGAGTNKVNIHTAAAVAYAYSKLLVKDNGAIKTPSLILGHDGGKFATFYSEVIMNVMMNNGVKVSAFSNDESQSNPLINFISKKMGCLPSIYISSCNGINNKLSFNVSNEFGDALSSSFVKRVNSLVGELDFLAITKKTTKTPNIISVKKTTDYFGDIYLNSQNSSIPKKIKVAFSTIYGERTKIEKNVLDLVCPKNFITNKNIRDNRVKKVVERTGLDDVNAYNSVMKVARKNKTDLAVVTSFDGNRVGVVAKYQKRFKYLSSDQMSALLLDFKLAQMKKDGVLPSDGYVVKSVIAGDLPTKIAKKYGVKVIEANTNFSNIGSIISENRGSFIMGYDGKFGFVINKEISNQIDALSTIVTFIELANYLTEKGTCVFSRLKELWVEHGIHRTVKNKIVADDNMRNRLIKNIKRLKEMNGVKVVSVDDYRHSKELMINEELLKVKLENNSWIAIKGDVNSASIFIQTVGAPEDSIMDVVIFEKEIESLIQENTESYPEKKISKKSVFKYLIFLGIMAVTMYLVFSLIYNGSKTNGDTFAVAKEIFTSNSRWIFLIGFVAYFFPVFLHAFQKKRLICALGQKVKWRHLAISAFMGSFISWITPFAIGGDGVGYWFLRRKGFKRGPLASSFLMGTIIYQFQIVVVSVVLLPMGIVMFRDQIFNGSAEMKVIITLFIIGACWNLFATFMIYMLTFNKRFQEWIVRTAIKLLEWLPFINVYDPGRLAATHQFTFYEIRSGMKLLWKKKLLLIECTFYEMITSFVNFYIFIPMLLGVIAPGLQFGTYFSPIVASDIVGTANSYSITPGGSGTGEYIAMTVNSHIYKPMNSVGNSSATATALDFIQKVTVQWPILIGSMISIITIIIGERRVKKYKKIDNNNKLKGKLTLHKTSFYKKVSIPLTLLFLCYLLTFFLIL